MLFAAHYPCFVACVHYAVAVVPYHMAPLFIKLAAGIYILRLFSRNKAAALCHGYRAGAYELAINYNASAFLHAHGTGKIKLRLFSYSKLAVFCYFYRIVCA